MDWLFDNLQFLVLIGIAAVILFGLPLPNGTDVLPNQRDSSFTLPQESGSTAVGEPIS